MNVFDFQKGNYYMLPNKIFPHYEKFYLSTHSPFYDKLQMYCNVIFESGIRQRWKRIFEEKKSSKMERDQGFSYNEQYLLTMSGVNGISYILVFGLAVSLYQWLNFWIFFWNFAKRLNIRRWFQKRAWRFKTRSRRVVQIQPFRNRLPPQTHDE